MALDGSCPAAAPTATGNAHYDDTCSESAGVDGVIGVALPKERSKWRLLLRPQFEDNLQSTL